MAGINGPVSDDLIDEVGLARVGCCARTRPHRCAGRAYGTKSWHLSKEHLDIARRRFAVAQTDEDRVDARLMATAVEVLTKQLPEFGGISSADEVSVDALARLAKELMLTLQERRLGYAGLDNWRGARLDAEVAWAGLARDVAATASALTRRSWYAASRTLTDVLAAYQATRCAQVLSSVDVAGLQAILAPRITQGIGRNAALITHLEDHVRSLESAAGDRTGHQTSQAISDNAELSVARQLLEAVRAQYIASGRDNPKSRSAVEAAAYDQFPLLTSLLPGTGLAGLVETNLGELIAIEEALAEQATQTIISTDSLVLSEVFVDCQHKLTGCRDYRGEVKQAFDQLLVLLLRFMHFRAQRSRSRPGTEYLFRPDALENELAYDVERFLAGSEIGYQVHTEVRDIGGGRVDVAAFFAGFTLVCELKREHNDVSVDGQRQHLLQAAAYQDSDVELGFLLVLDLRVRTGPPPHLRANVQIVELNDEALGGSRNVAMLVVPGNRRSPSAVS